MKSSWIKSLALTGALALQSHAIFGIGGHWAPALGMEVKANRDTIASLAGGSALLNEKGASGLQGFGGKMWIDALPFIDLEMAGNLQFGYYDVDLITPAGTSPLKFKLSKSEAFNIPFCNMLVTLLNKRLVLCIVKLLPLNNSI